MSGTETALERLARIVPNEDGYAASVMEVYQFEPKGQFWDDLASITGGQTHYEVSGAKNGHTFEPLRFSPRDRNRAIEFAQNARFVVTEHIKRVIGDFSA